MGEVSPSSALRQRRRDEFPPQERRIVGARPGSAASSRRLQDGQGVLDRGAIALGDELVEGGALAVPADSEVGHAIQGAFRVTDLTLGRQFRQHASAPLA
jgi:hypothetical protein